MQTIRSRHVLSTLGRLPFDRRTQLAGLIALAGYCVYQVLISPGNCEGWIWDWPAISALGLVLVVVRVAARVNDVLSHALRRLRARSVITCSEDAFEQFNKTLDLLRRRRAPGWGFIIGLAMVVSFAMSWKWGIACRPAAFEVVRIALLAVLTPTCYAAGYYVGWMVVQGRLAHILNDQGIKYIVQPGHADGAAGLRPLGDFFFRQALLAGLAPAYLAFWLAFFPYHLRGMTRSVFLVLLPVFVFIEVVVFVWPMWSFHREMVRQKRSLVVQADALASRMSRTQAELRQSTDPASVRELEDRLEMDLKLFEELENLPTWPVSKQIRRRFALQNIILLALPLASQLLGSRVVEFVRGILR